MAKKTTAKKSAAKPASKKAAKKPVKKAAVKKVVKAAKKATAKPKAKKPAKVKAAARKIAKPKAKRKAAPRPAPRKVVKRVVKRKPPRPPETPVMPLPETSAAPPERVAEPARTEVNGVEAAGSLPLLLNEMIEKAWPERMIDFGALDFQETYLAPIVDKIRAELLHIEPSCAFYEKKPIGAEVWMSDQHVDLPSEGEFPRSYHLFYVGPLGPQFEGECETVEEKADGSVNMIQGKYRWGWTIAISCVAPVAALVIDTISEYANGTIDYLELNLHFNEEDAPEDVRDSSAKDRLPVEAWDKLSTMRDKIAILLQAHGIQTLPHEILSLPVPRFKTAEETLIDADELRVKDAFFFQSI
jgi:hypothetical protein